MAAMGWTQNLGAAMSNFYDQLNRVFRLDKCFLLPLVATNGVLQGCSLSVLATNCMYTALGRRIRSNLPNLHASNFIVDKNFLATKNKGLGRHEIQGNGLEVGLSMIEQFNALTGQEMNQKKTHVLFSHMKTRRSFR